MPKAKPAQELAPVPAGQPARLERCVRALAKRVFGAGPKLSGCTQCQRYAERQAIISSPVSGSKAQDLCGRCEPKHPILGMPGVTVSELELVQAGAAREANADLDLLLEGLADG